MRQVIDRIGNDLEEHRFAAADAVARVAKEHGEFRTIVNGHYFEDSSDWFQAGQQSYWDCPGISFGKGVRRCNELYLAGVASIRDLELAGRGFVNAVSGVVGNANTRAKRSLVATSKLFDKDCRRLDKHLKRIKVHRRDCLEVLLCLHRQGLPGGVCKVVFDCLV